MATNPQESAQWLEPLTAISESIQASKEFRFLLESPSFSDAEKWSVLSEVADKFGSSKELKNFLQILVKSKRIAAISEIVQGFKARILEKQNIVEAMVESATDLTAAQVQRVKELLEKTMGKKVAVKVQLQPTLLAGFRIHVAGLTMDASLKANIDSIHKNLLNSDFAKRGVRAEA